VIWGTREAKYFSQEGLPVRQISGASQGDDIQPHVADIDESFRAR
jgi:hypothetical protein